MDYDISKQTFSHLYVRTQNRNKPPTAPRDHRQFDKLLRNALGSAHSQGLMLFFCSCERTQASLRGGRFRNQWTVRPPPMCVWSTLLGTVATWHCISKRGWLGCSPSGESFWAPNWIGAETRSAKRPDGHLKPSNQCSGAVVKYEFPDWFSASTEEHIWKKLNLGKVHIFTEKKIS